MFNKVLLGIIGVSCGLIVVGMAVGIALENKRLKEDIANSDSNYIVVKGKVITTESK